MVQQISPLPDAPSRSDTEEQFVQKSDAWLAAQATFVTETNAVATEVESNADAAATSATAASDSAAAASTSASEAAQSALTASGAANYQGDYDAGTLYAVGESVSYLGSVFVKKTTAPAGTTPVDGTDWLEISEGGVADFQEFTSSGTWTKPDGATFVRVEVVGAGGGGGNIATGSNAGGGGGGEGSLGLFLASSLGATEVVAIGAGGSGAPSGSTGDGSVGGNSSFGSHLVGRGGGLGTSASYSPYRGECASGSGLQPAYISSTEGIGQGGFSGGSGSMRYDGGGAVIGGAGGGGSQRSQAGSGGASHLAGDGGNGSFAASTKGGDGQSPGGGGGASSNDGGGGDGGDGRVRVWSW